MEREGRRKSDESHGYENQSGDDDSKHEPASPTDSSNFILSRTSSFGSSDFHAPSSSSAQNSDDEDSDQRSAMSYKERRREAHTHAEQKRRDAIKKGYAELQDIVPTFLHSEIPGAQKISKVTVLQKSVDYMQFLIQHKKKQEEELTALRKEVEALEIMKINYEKILSAQHNSSTSHQNDVSDKLKFQVFQTIMDNLFQSFNASISVANFAELSGCVLNWIEEYCKPQSLRELTLSVLSYFNPQIR